MKSERRHKLERNELAEGLGTVLAPVQSALPMILGGLAVLAVGSILWGLYSASQRKQESAAWREYYFNLTSGDPDTYLDVAEGFPKSRAAGWARQTAGDTYLESGIDALYRNRSEGIDLIQHAIESFEKVNSDSSSSDELRARAVLGLAQAHESLGEVEEAKKYYQQFSTLPSSPQLISAVSERIEFLESETGTQFYAWFTKLDPKPDSVISLPSGLDTPPTAPGFGFGNSGSGLPTGGGLPGLPSGLPSGGLPSGGMPPAGDPPSGEAPGNAEVDTGSAIDPSTLPPLPTGDVPAGPSENGPANSGAAPDVETPELPNFPEIPVENPAGDSAAAGDTGSDEDDS